MPIYAYRCEACGFSKDVLQKISDPQLTVCLSCGEPTFKKQLTAAGFQLKGTGWYVTDFRGGASTNGAPAAAAGGTETAPAATPAAPAATPAATSTASSTTPAATSAATPSGGTTPSGT
jgi:putative FmdB family regulatory protein